MPSLKDLKNRIGSVKNTRKITKAMQMVLPRNCAVRRKRQRLRVPMQIAWPPSWPG